MKIAEALATGQDVTVKSDGSAELTGVNLPGLPDGVVAVAYRDAEATEFTIWDGNIRTTTFGKQLIVKPATGYEFAYQVTMNRYAVRKK